MKPFDLEAAKAGAPVVLRDGSEVIISLFDARDRDKDYPLMGFVRGKVSDWYCCWHLDGTYINKNGDWNLYMKTVKKSGWVGENFICKTKDDAEKYYGASDAIQVEWEE